MKTLLRLAFIVSFLLLPKWASAQEADVDFDYFYQTLAPYGSWIQVEGYGYCWQPTIRDADWQPYAFGHWAHTDDGWLWISDDTEPWGWICYHYGRWINFDNLGWVWVPGYTWAPAWVTWRYGDGYCGWAPMPPSRYPGEISFGWFNFCAVTDMGMPYLRHCIIKRTYNYVYFGRTIIIVGGRPHSGGRYYAQGPDWNEINRHSRQPIPHYTLDRRGGRPQGDIRNFRPQEQNNRVTVFAPTVRREQPKTTPPNPMVYQRNPVVNNGSNAYRPPRATNDTPPSAEPNRWMNRAAVSSSYKHDAAPPAPQQIQSTIVTSGGARPSDISAPAVNRTPNASVPSPRVEQHNGGGFNVNPEQSRGNRPEPGQQHQPSIQRAEVPSRPQPQPQAQPQFQPQPSRQDNNHGNNNDRPNGPGHR
jgi:hypothetical protein